MINKCVENITGGKLVTRQFTQDTILDGPFFDGPAHVPNWSTIKLGSRPSPGKKNTITTGTCLLLQLRHKMENENSMLKNMQ